LTNYILIVIDVYQKIKGVN